MCQRQNRYKRNEDLEGLLKEINDILEPVEDKILHDYRRPRYPVVLIMGCARSGTTLMLQWLATTGRFAYPTNLLSRFFRAPYIGAKIQQLLANPRFDFKQELSDYYSDISFTSDLGKTKGALAPNGFTYFWRRFVSDDNEFRSDEDVARFMAELAAIEAVFDKPLALKGMVANWIIPYLSSVFDQVLFVFVKRKPFYTIQSLLEAREKYYGNHTGWYSFKPKEYDNLKDRDPIEQVTGQVYFTNKAVEEGLGQIEVARCLQVSYEEFCAAPEGIFKQLKEKFAQQGFEIDWEYTGPKQFQHNNQVRLSKDDCEKILDAYKHFSKLDLTL